MPVDLDLDSEALDASGQFAVADDVALGDATGSTAAPGVYWLLGVPVESIDMQGAVGRIEEAVRSRRQLVFGTPNLNFLATAGHDAHFRRCLLNTRLCTADGMPLVWLGRLLGIPSLKRVAGSDLVDHLQARSGARPLSVFFFGGDAGVAAAAAAALDRAKGGLRSAGWLDPGRGSVEEMSTPEIVAKINSSKADFLLVALGARKGHEWIERNRAALNVPVISHLGAVINFLAGTVRRAPRAWRGIGLEWLWRIGQEPNLVSRYARDGLYLGKETLLAVLPLLAWRVMKRLRAQPDKLAVIQSATQPNVYEVRGALVRQTLEQLQRLRAKAPREGRTTIKLEHVTDLDCAGIGLLYELVYRSQGRFRIQIADRGGLLRWLFERNRARSLLDSPFVTSEVGRDGLVADAQR
jgi:N-acetylglucosaminyldiphosphoundecaprenol N-acetyl-beta-D-mannosaminyltransferase